LVWGSLMPGVIKLKKVLEDDAQNMFRGGGTGKGRGSFRNQDGASPRTKSREERGKTQKCSNLGSTCLRRRGPRDRAEGGLRRYQGKTLLENASKGGGLAERFAGWQKRSISPGKTRRRDK